MNKNTMPDIISESVHYLFHLPIIALCILCPKMSICGGKNPMVKFKSPMKKAWQ